MKLSILAFLTLLSTGVYVTGNAQHEYRGYTVSTEEDEENVVALCGTNVDGCVSLPTTSIWKGCWRIQAQLGSLEELEEVVDDSHQQAKRYKWKYEDGLLKPAEYRPDNWYSWSSLYGGAELCLGPKARELKSGRSYKLLLQHCPKENELARHMRFIMTDDGKVQSLAPVIEEDKAERDENRNLLQEMESNKYCMSISKDNGMRLKSCGDSHKKTLQQELEPYGAFEPFIMTLQEGWGLQDVVEFSYSFVNEVEDNHDGVYLSIYKRGGKEGDIVHATEASTLSGIFAVDVASNLAGAGDYEAKFEAGGMEQTFAFTVSKSAHWGADGNENGLSSYSYRSEPTYILVWIGAGLLLLYVGGMLLYIGGGKLCCKQTKEQQESSVSKGSEMTDTDDEDDASSDTSSAVSDQA